MALKPRKDPFRNPFPRLSNFIDDLARTSTDDQYCEARAIINPTEKDALRCFRKNAHLDRWQGQFKSLSDAILKFCIDKPDVFPLSEAQPVITLARRALKTLLKPAPRTSREVRGSIEIKELADADLAKLIVERCKETKPLFDSVFDKLDEFTQRYYLWEERETAIQFRKGVATDRGEPAAKQSQAKAVDGSGTPRKRRKRRRQYECEPTTLTPAQLEAMQLVSDHNGNITKAAKAAGKSRQAMTKLYNKANKKLTRIGVKRRPKTTKLRTDRRGQVDVEDSKAVDPEDIDFDD